MDLETGHEGSTPSRSASSGARSQQIQGGRKENGSIAQPVEQRAFNPQVLGSTPSGSTKAPSPMPQ